MRDRNQKPMNKRDFDMMMRYDRADQPLLQITPKRTTRSSIDADAKNASEVKERRRKKPSSAKAPTEPKPKKPRRTEEEKRERKRTYMKKWRKDNPKASYESVKRWRENNPDKHRTYTTGNGNGIV